MSCVLMVLAQSQTYPHLLRHAQILHKEHGKVHVLCVGENPAQEGIVFHTLLPQMPKGMSDFILAAQRAYQILGQIRPNVIEAIDPPMLIPASIWSRFHSARLLYFSMELWSELPSLQARPLKKVLWRLLESGSLWHKSVQIATVSSGVARILAQRWNRMVHVIRSIPPRPISQEIPIDIRAQFKIPMDKRILIYQGLVENGRGIEKIAEAILQYQVPWHFVIVGAGPMESELKSKFAQSTKIHFCGRLEYRESLRWIAGADAGAVMIDDFGLSFRHCLPGKIFEYLHQGLPIILSPLPDLQAFGAEFDCAVVAEDWQLSSIASALSKLSQEIETKKWQNLAEHSQELYTWESEGVKLTELLPK